MDSNFSNSDVVENVTGCRCCNGDAPIFWKDSENWSSVNNKGEILTFVRDMPFRYKVKYCPECGRKF